MTAHDDLNREIQALRERISALGAASLRVGSSLDLDTVLREIAESARVLTAARYAVITTTGEDGELADVVLSGFTPEEERLLEAWNDSMKVFDALRDLPSPLRVTPGTATTRQGRNLHRNGTHRQPWTSESDPRAVLTDKHERGTATRTARNLRNNEYDFF